MHHVKPQPTAQARARRRPASSIFVRIGSWFEASATGWGILALPAIVLLLLGVGLLRMVVT